MAALHRRRPDPDRPSRGESRCVRGQRARPGRHRLVEATGAITHFGGLCRIVEQLQAEVAEPDPSRHDANRFSRLLALAARLDHRGDGSGHDLRRSLCIGLQQRADRVEAAGSLIASVVDRPAEERSDLYRLMEHLLIVGFVDRQPMTTAQCRSMHAMLAAATGTLRDDPGPAARSWKTLIGR